MSSVPIPMPKILIVDDTPSNIKILGDELKAEYAVNFASSGEEALRMAVSEHPPHLIILDILMPGMDGYEVCRRLKADPRTRHIPVIFITAQSEENDKGMGIKLGACDYLTKPLKLPIVKARVKNYIELAAYRERMENTSCYDRLTGLPNRRRFEEIIDREWRRALRGHRYLSLIRADIDFFKSYNAHYGPATGDICILKVAKTLTSCLKRAGDFIARYSAEEFAIILPESNLNGTAFITEAMRNSLESLNIEHARAPLNRITISIGASCLIPRRNQSLEMITQSVEKNLMLAKESGGNHIIADELTQTDSAEKSDIEAG